MSPERDAILGRRARLVALSLAGAGLSLQAQHPASAQAPAASASASGAQAPGALAPLPQASEEEKHHAKALLNLALDEINNGSITQAIGALQKAVQLYPHPTLLLRLADTWEQSGNTERALPVYERALASEGLTPKQREEVSARASKLRARLGVVRLTVSPEQTQVEIDGTPAQPGTFYLRPGAHKVAARAPDRQPLTLSFDLAAGEQKDLALTLSTPAIAMPCLSPPRLPPPPPVQGGGCGCGNPGAGT